MLYESIALPTELRWREDIVTLPVKQTVVKAGFPAPALFQRLFHFAPSKFPLAFLNFSGQQFFRAPAACLRERRQFKKLLCQR